MTKKIVIYISIIIVIAFSFSVSFSAVHTRLNYVNNTYNTPSAGLGTLIIDVEAISDDGQEFIRVFQDAIQLDANLNAQNPQVSFSDQRFPSDLVPPGLPNYNVTEDYQASDGRIRYVYTFNYGTINTIETSYTQIVRITIQYDMAAINGSIDWYSGAPVYLVTDFLSAEITGDEEAIPGLLTDISLPVELSSFSAEADIGNVTLSWTTESEINNEGFEVYRSLEEEGVYSLIDSYKSNDDLTGHGNSSTGHEYSYIDNTITQSQTYWYKIADVDVNGVRTYHGPISVDLTSNSQFAGNNIPTEFNLYQNYPNPFNPITTIKFALPEQVITKICVFNSSGQIIENLVDEILSEGIHEIKFNRKNLSSGIYYYRMITNNYIEIRKMVLLK